MYLLNDRDHNALMLIESAVATALTWPACDQAAALRAARDDLRIILKNTVKDDPHNPWNGLNLNYGNGG